MTTLRKELEDHLFRLKQELRSKRRQHEHLTVELVVLGEQVENLEKVLAVDERMETGPG
jgi:hypothetical protein